MLSKFKKILIFILFSSAVITAQSRTLIRLERTEKRLPFGLTEQIPIHFPKVGLALSGGGARSISQIGVLKAFEEEKIPLDMILGTSMGSIVGGLYSAGYSISQLDSVLRSTDWPSFFSPKQSGRNELFVDQKITEDRAVVSFRLDGLNPILPTSVSSGQRAANYLNLLALNAPLQNIFNFDDLIYKFRAISTDLISGQKIIIQNGSLGTAMRASSSITLLLPPVKIDSMLLVDGGLVSNLPARETRKLGADIVIAVNSSSPLYSQPELNKPWTIADQLVSIPMKILNEQQIEEADYVITPQLNGTKNTDFTNHDYLIEEGYKAAKPVAAEIKKEIEGLFRRKLNYDTGYFKNIFLKKTASPIDMQLFNSIQNKDSVSARDLRFEIYRMLQTDQWKDLQIVIDQVNDSSFISVIAEANPLINQIIVEGVALLDLSEIDTLLASKNYRYYNSKTAFNAALEILRLYRKNGYPLANIKEIIFNEINNTLLISINEGIICEIEVTGNTRTNQKLITRELPMRIGEFFQYKYAETGLTNLRSTNLFDNIELITKTKNDSISILIDVDERISSVIRLGFRIDNENFNQLSIDIRDENFRGTGTEIGATFAGGIRNRFFSIEQKSNRVFDSYLTYKIRAFHEFNDVNVYEEVNTNNEKSFRRNKTGEYRQIFYGGSFGIGSQVGRFGNAFMEARYQRDEIKNKSDFIGDTYKIDISTLRFSIAVDSQNDYPYPTSGFFVNAFYETAQTILGGDIGYTKLFVDYKSIFSYETVHAWSLRTMIGFADQTLPLSQQFSLGGQNLFFGLRDNELRGRQIALASLEYRYKLPFKIFFDTYVRMRYDLGSIWSEREAIRFKDLLHGIGTTLSIKTPIGPADFSVGRSFLFKNTLTKNIISRGEIFFYFTIGYYY